MRGINDRSPMNKMQSGDSLASAPPAQKPAEAPDHEILMAGARACIIAAGRRPVRLAEFLSFTGFRKRDIYKYYPRWNDFLAATGFGFQPYKARIEERRLLADWARIVLKFRRIPTHKEYAIHGKYSPATYENRFGRWAAVPGAFRAFAGNRRKWKNVVTLLPAEDQSQQEHQPPAAAKAAPARPLGRYPRVRNAGHALRLPGRAASGPPLGLPGMRNAPLNEQGVVYLFGLLAPSLGFDAEAFQAAYPDCEARRQIAPGKWQSIRIEFEYESRHFEEHGHDPAGCDLIICWEHNWEECPKNLEVIALKDKLPQLSQ